MKDLNERLKIASDHIDKAIDAWEKLKTCMEDPSLLDDFINATDGITNEDFQAMEDEFEEHIRNSGKSIQGEFDKDEENQKNN